MSGPRRGLDRVTCSACGAQLKRHPAGGRLIHVQDGVVAACDRDADHLPSPDWAAALPLHCTTCGAPLMAERGALRHEDRSVDDDHEPDPWAPPITGTGSFMSI